VVAEGQVRALLRQLSVRAEEDESDASSPESELDRELTTTKGEVQGRRRVVENKGGAVAQARSSWQRELTREGIEPNPGPKLSDVTNAINMAMTRALEIFQSADGRRRAPLDAMKEIALTSGFAPIPANTDRNVLEWIESYPPISITCLRSVINNNAAHTDNEINYMTAVKPTHASAPSVRAIALNAQIAPLARAVTGSNTGAEALQNLFSTIRTNFDRFNGQTVAEFFGTFLPQFNTAEPYAIAGSVARNICVAMAWLMTDFAVDIHATLHAPYGQFVDTLQDYRVSAPVAGVAAQNEGIFPWSPGYGLNTRRVRAIVVTFGELMEMANTNLASGTSWDRALWSETYFAIVPISTGDALQNPAHISALTYTYLHHPFVVPQVYEGVTAGMGVIDRDLQAYTLTAPALAKHFAVPAAFHSPIPGPRPATDTSQLSVMYVVVDIGDAPGVGKDARVSVGSSTLAVTLTTSNPTRFTVDVDIGEALYTGAMINKDVQIAMPGVLDLLLRRLASKECLMSALAWMISVVPRTKLPVAKLGGTTNALSGRFTTFNGGVAAPAWLTGFTQADSFGEAQPTAYGWTPAGQIEFMPSAAVNNWDPVYALDQQVYHGRLPSPNVWGDLALLVGWAYIPPDAVMKPQAHVNVREVAKLAIMAGGMFTHAIDLAVEWSGMGVDLFADQTNLAGSPSGPLVVQIWRRIYEEVNPLLGGFQLSQVPLGRSEWRQVSTSGVGTNTFTPRRMPLHIYGMEMVPTHWNVEIGTKNVSHLESAYQDTHVRLPMYEGRQEDGRSWKESVEASARIITATGRIGIAINTQTLITSEDANGFFTPQYSGMGWPQWWVDTIWDFLTGTGRGVYPTTSCPTLGLPPRWRGQRAAAEIAASVCMPRFTLASASGVLDGCVTLPDFIVPRKSNAPTMVRYGLKGHFDVSRLVMEGTESARKDESFRAAPGATK
jgi:hypothetical protein